MHLKLSFLVIGPRYKCEHVSEYTEEYYPGKGICGGFNFPEDSFRLQIPFQFRQASRVSLSRLFCYPGLGQQRGYGGKRETDSAPSSIYQIAFPSSHKLIPRSSRRVIFSLSLLPWKFEEKGFGPGNLNRRIAVESSPSICPARTSVRSLSPRMKFAGDCSVHHQRQQQRGL